MRNDACQMIDTFDAFLAWWEQARARSLSDQLRGWHGDYMAGYPELRQVQLEDHANQDSDWRKVAAQHIFPYLEDWLPAMRQARGHLLTLAPQVWRRAEELFGPDFIPCVVLYVGIGCGAGWATRYGGQPACLMGLEMIAQNKWHTPDHLEGLFAHELGHLLHMSWRGEWEDFGQAKKDPLFLLYSEGFAQRCEGRLLGRPSWHMVQDGTWLDWCRHQQAWLARLFLQEVEQGRPVQGFFGSWYDIAGRRQSGYFLGHAWIEEMEKSQDLREIALLPPDQVHRNGLDWLRRMSASS